MLTEKSIPVMLDLILKDTANEEASEAVERQEISDRPAEKIALFDMDGTLVDFDGAMRRAMKSLASEDEIARDVYYPPERANESSHVAARRRMVKRIPGFWRELPQLSIGMRLLQEAMEIGFRITILTKAPRTNHPAWTEKVEWLWKNLPMEEKGIEVHLAEDKGLVYGRMLCDDWPPYIERWLTWRPRGLVLMPDQPWNQGFHHTQVVRVTGHPGSIQSAVLLMKYQWNRPNELQGRSVE
jgi:5'-nucleotidase